MHRRVPVFLCLLALGLSAATIAQPAGEPGTLPTRQDFVALWHEMAGEPGSYESASRKADTTIAALVALGDPGFDVLIDAVAPEGQPGVDWQVAHHRASLQARMIDALADAGVERAETVLIDVVAGSSVLIDADPASNERSVYRTRADAAARALGKLGLTSAIPTLRLAFARAFEALPHGAEVVQSFPDALIELGDDGYVEHLLIDALTQEDGLGIPPTGRLAVASASGRRPARVPRTSPTTRRATPPWELAQRAAFLAQKVESRTLVPVLIDYLDETSDVNAEASLSALTGQPLIGAPLWRRWWDRNGPAERDEWRPLDLDARTRRLAAASLIALLEIEFLPYAPAMWSRPGCIRSVGEPRFAAGDWVASRAHALGVRAAVAEYLTERTTDTLPTTNQRGTRVVQSCFGPQPTISDNAHFLLAAIEMYEPGTSPHGGVPVSRARTAGLTFGLAIVFAFAVIACLPRYQPVDRGPDPYPVESLAQEMDPWLLAEGFAEKLVIEIDWVEGCKPGPRTLAGFEKIVHKYVPDDREIEILLDDEIPRDAWDTEAKGHAATGKLAQQFADTVSRPEPNVEKRYVLFVPRFGRLFGISTHWRVERDGEQIPIEGVVVAREEHEKKAKLWLSRDRFERGTLIHEFGHEFGLVANERHERVKQGREGHCTGLKCLMAHPTPRVIVRNAAAGVFNRFPRDYCRYCQEDIRRAQQHWREQSAADPDYRASFRRRRELQKEWQALYRMVRKEQWTEVVERSAELRQAYPGHGEWVDMEATALVNLGREEEALETLLVGLEDDPHASTYWKQRQRAGRLLIGVGRHEEAVALFDRDLLRGAKAYDFEQSSYVLKAALRGLGRFDESADLVAELLERGHSVSFSKPSMEAGYAGDLVRAGRHAEAEALVKRGLKKKLRGYWIPTARALYEEQGREDEARAMLAEMLQSAEEYYQKASKPRSRWRLGWRTVVLAAESGDLDAAVARARALEQMGEPEGLPSFSAIPTLAAGWIALGDLDRAAELVAASTIRDRGFYDPCGADYLAPLRESPDHADLFAHCP